ncbi:MAG: Ig-like domain-containing protein [Alistipes sp.]|nr:Ig-like domain-containing protein [Alistipes sp.]
MNLLQKHKRYATAVRTAVALILIGGIFSRCAHTMTPQGGPKDTIPPVIVAMTPDNFATNVKTVGNKIYVEFNEFVQLKDQNKEFFTSPAMKKKPILTIRGKGVAIQIRDTLLENTTYALNFGSAIRDNNEGNPLNAMRYVFSTGDKVDSMYCSGYTADSYKADSVSKSYIWFYIADSLPDTPGWDSTMFNRKPDVIARAENNGIFIAQNLKPVPYRIYAYQDKNDNQLYEAGSDLVGFVDSLYNPAELPDFAIWFDSLRMYPTAEPQLYFRMFMDETFKRQTLQAAERPSRHQALLQFGAAHPRIEEIRFDSISNDNIIFDPQTIGRDTIALWFNVPAEELPDTIKGEITYYKHDSIRQLVKTTEPLKLAWKYIETKEEERERIKQEKEKERAEKAGETYTPPKKPNPFKFKMPQSGDVNPEQHLTVDFDFPLTKLDSAAVKLTEVDENGGEKPVKITFERDTANMRRWRLVAKWKELAKYNLMIPSGAIENVAGEQNDTIKGSYTGIDHEKFATVIVDLKGKPDSTKYIVQLTNAQGALQQEKRNVSGGKIVFNYVAPGDIKMRLIEDANGNGKWDSGNVVERRQPERSELYVNENGEDTFVTKANWEMELAMDMNKLFAPVTMQSLIKILDDREEQRIKKLEEERAKKQKEGKDGHNQQGAQSGGGFGFGGIGSSMGGMSSGGFQQAGSMNQMAR